LVLGIETSCDDTGCAVLDGTGRVLATVVSSQLAVHRPYGGVVPEIASREHLKNWPAVSAEALQTAGTSIAEMDVIAATRGPGLVGCLLVGLSLGKAFAFANERPFFGVHHLEGHLFSPFLRLDGEPAEAVPDEFLGLVVSGGHTNLFRVENGGIFTRAETRDDAMGEVFDKIGKRIGLPYPQGPRVDELAEEGDGTAFDFAIPRMADGSLDFSYSGLKTEVLRALEKLEASGTRARVEDGRRPPASLLDVLASFRRAAVAQILDRLERVHVESPIPMLAVSGGVAANRLLRRELTTWCEERGVPLRLVSLGLSGDNAAMIAYAALLRHRRGERDDPLATLAASRIPI
jgi:N6-L-threonylcarbamoyladenine synthase